MTRWRTCNNRRRRKPRYRRIIGFRVLAMLDAAVLSMAYFGKAIIVATERGPRILHPNDFYAAP